MDKYDGLKIRNENKNMLLGNVVKVKRGIGYSKVVKTVVKA